MIQDLSNGFGGGAGVKIWRFPPRLEILITRGGGGGL